MHGPQRFWLVSELSSSSFGIHLFGSQISSPLVGLCLFGMYIRRDNVDKDEEGSNRVCENIFLARESDIVLDCWGHCHSPHTLAT